MTVLTKEVKIRVVRQNSNRAIYKKKKKKRPKGAQEDILQGMIRNVLTANWN